uniref:type I secretion system permease/ATPase n=1 Tax=Halomonas sp. TaxID=1486246 RepID=UPI00261B6EE3|nr:type I secretion system permease/ATPase [Halomonas sp.]
MGTRDHEAWLTAFVAVAKHHRLDFSEENVRVAMSWEQDSPLDLYLEDMGKQLGMAARSVSFSTSILTPWRMPMVVQLHDGQIGMVEKIDRDGKAHVQFTTDAGLATPFDKAELAEKVALAILLKPRDSAPDARVDEYLKPYKRNWLWSIVFRDWRRYTDIIIASLVANVLALAGMTFSMQVYDRVVPAQSYPTLWVLFGGVMLAICFEFCMRLTRTHISDVIGKRADLRLSDKVFGHALRVQNSARSKSTASFISQVRELEQVRDLVTSTTIGAVADLPFFFLFAAVIWLIGGPLVFIVLAAVPLLLIPGMLLQRPLARLANDGLRESAVRNATLIESVENVEDIKLLCAEQRFQNQWNHANQVSADIAKRQRFLVGMLMTWTQEVQSIVYASVLLTGAYLVINGDLTTGALVGTSILASRTIAPLSQISGVLSRWQQAKVARNGLDELMKRPLDQPENGRAVHKAVIRGGYDLRNVEFWYDEEKKVSNLSIPNLSIKPGEKIALLGRNGAGKSTLLQLLAGMRFASQGRVLIDDVNITSLDTGDLRRDMCLLHQNTKLFFGSLRENLIMGSPLATDEEIHQALVLSGALSFVQQQQGGLDYMIMEGGLGLSGGQRQALLLARLLIRSPNIVLLDEPTAAMDEMTERQVVKQLKRWMGQRTLVVATHRPELLDLVDRVIVVNDGKIVADDARDVVLKKFSKAS